MDILYNASAGIWVLFGFCAILVGVLIWSAIKFIIYAFGPNPKKKKRY